MSELLTTEVLQQVAVINAKVDQLRRRSWPAIAKAVRAGPGRGSEWLDEGRREKAFWVMNHGEIVFTLQRSEEFVVLGSVWNQGTTGEAIYVSGIRASADAACQLLNLVELKSTDLRIAAGFLDATVRLVRQEAWAVAKRSLGTSEFDRATEATARAFGVKQWELIEKGRSDQNVVEARLVLARLLRTHYRASFPKIAGFMQRDHTTIMTAVRKVERSVALSSVVDRLVRELSQPEVGPGEDPHGPEQAAREGEPAELGELGVGGEAVDERSDHGDQAGEQDAGEHPDSLGTG